MLAIFSNAQRIISQILNFMQTGAQTRTANILTDTFSAGINNSTTGIGEGFIIVPGSNNTSVNPSVNITTGGIAIDPVGNRIFISPSDVSLYNATNPATTTNDGLGNLLSTPQSTGVVNVPMVQSSQNYIWVDYLATIDPTQFTLNAETNAKIFYAQTDGYLVSVTQVNTKPDANSIFLGSVNMTGGGAVASSNISQVGRTYYNINPNVVPITTPQAGTNPPDRTPSYAPATTYTLEAHIKAVGTGSGISPTNPHNMSLEDLGISVLDTVQEHRILEHGNAIIAGVPGTPYPSISAMAQSINIVDPGSDTLNIYALSSTEFAIVNGSAFNANTIFGAIPTNATIAFPAATGTYNVYWDSVALGFGVTLSDISNDLTKLWLATVTYTVNFTPGYNHLSGLLDRRRVGSTTHLLQRWTNNSRPGDGSLQPQSGEFGFNLTSNLLEYWDGSAWQQPVNASSNATVPTGTLLPYAGASAPTGFLLANGASVSTVTFPNLFAVIGYSYGGSGASFNVPNMTNNIPVGIGGSIVPALGNTAGGLIGSDTVTPTENSHQHITPTLAVAGQIVNSNGGSDWPYGQTSVSLGGDVFAGAGSGGSGTYTALNTSPTTATINPVTVNVPTIQPSIGVNYIIKT